MSSYAHTDQIRDTNSAPSCVRFCMNQMGGIHLVWLHCGDPRLCHELDPCHSEDIHHLHIHRDAQGAYGFWSVSFLESLTIVAVESYEVQLQVLPSLSATSACCKFIFE